MTRNSAGIGRGEADLFRALARAEDEISRRVAERALAATDEAHKRVLRSVWRMAQERAEHFANMAVEASGG